MAASEFAAKVEALEVKPLPGRSEPSLQLVENYEKEFGLALPADYREFLASYGGISLSARYPFAEPTPFGQTGMIDDFFGFVPAGNRVQRFSVHWNTQLIDGAPDVVAIGSDLMGGMTWLKCTGEDAGSVYHHDGDQRGTWSDAEFYGHFTNLHPEIERYLELRRGNLLPTKPRGYENVYLIARSFSEFIVLLRPAHDRRKPLPDPAPRAHEETEISEAGTTDLTDDHAPRDTPILSSAPPVLIRLCSIKRSSICGAIDLDGKWRIPPVYRDVLIHNDFIVAHDAPFRFGQPKSRFVFFDAQGNQVGERTHNSIFPGAGAEGLLALDEDGKWGYIDRTGKFVIPPRFDMAYRFTDGEAKVIDAGVFSYIDKSGKVIMRAPAGVDSMSPYNADGIAAVIKDDKGGLIRRDGTFVVPPKFARFGGIAEGIIAAGEDEGGPVGLLDYSGKWIKAPQFDWINTYSGGLAEARKGGRSGYIDTCGNWRIPPKYSVEGPTWPFSKNGTIVRTMDGGKLVVDRDGNEKPLPEGWDIDFFRWEADLVVVVDRDAKRGLMDSSGKIVVAPKYAWLEPVGGGVYIARRVRNTRDNRLILDVRRGEIEIDPPPAVPGWSD